MIFSKELEKLTEEYAFNNEATSSELSGRLLNAHLAGAAALENLILKSGGEEFRETEAVNEFNKHPPYLCGLPCEHSYIEGAKFKHYQFQLIIGGLKHEYEALGRDYEKLYTDHTNLLNSGQGWKIQQLEAKLKELENGK